MAHDGTCARKAAHDCRPVTEASDSMVHLWQPAGTVFYDSEVSISLLIRLCCSGLTARSSCSAQMRGTDADTDVGSPEASASFPWAPMLATDVSTLTNGDDRKRFKVR